MVKEVGGVFGRASGLAPRSPLAGTQLGLAPGVASAGLVPELSVDRRAGRRPPALTLSQKLRCLQATATRPGQGSGPVCSLREFSVRLIQAPQVLQGESCITAFSSAQMTGRNVRWQPLPPGTPLLPGFPLERKSRAFTAAACATTVYCCCSPLGMSAQT